MLEFMRWCEERVQNLSSISCAIQSNSSSEQANMFLVWLRSWFAVVTPLNNGTLGSVVGNFVRMFRLRFWVAKSTAVVKILGIQKVIQYAHSPNGILSNARRTTGHAGKPGRIHGPTSTVTHQLDTQKNRWRWHFVQNVQRGWSLA